MYMHMRICLQIVGVEMKQFICKNFLESWISIKYASITNVQLQAQCKLNIQTCIQILTIGIVISQVVPLGAHCLEHYFMSCMLVYTHMKGNVSE